jgi:hypothetical protein
VGVAVDGVEADVDVLAADAGEELVLVPPALLGAATEVLWLLDVELLLPQPARITAAVSAIRSHAESFRIIGPPSLKNARPAMWPRQAKVVAQAIRIEVANDR